jgi:hypothetical protein
MASLSPAAPSSPKRLRVYSSATVNGDDAGSGKRVGTHNGSFHCDEALGCFLIRLTSQFAGADVVRTRDSQVGPFLASLPARIAYSIPWFSPQNPIGKRLKSEDCLCLGLWVLAYLIICLYVTYITEASGTLIRYEFMLLS